MLSVQTGGCVLCEQLRGEGGPVPQSCFLGGASTASVPAISIYCLGRGPSLVSAPAACNPAGSVHILPCGREPRPTWHRGPEHVLGTRPSSCRCLLGPTSSCHRLSAVGKKNRGAREETNPPRNPPFLWRAREGSLPYTTREKRRASALGEFYDFH